MFSSISSCNRARCFSDLFGLNASSNESAKASAFSESVVASPVGVLIWGIFFFVSD